MDRQPDLTAPAGTLPGLRRRDLIKALGAVGIGASVGSSLLPTRAVASDGLPSATELEPGDLTFSIVDQRRPFDLLAKNFVQLRDDFDGDLGGYQVLAPEQNAGDVVTGGGALRIGGDSAFALLRSATGQQAPYATVIVDVTSFAGTGGAHDTVYAGLVKDAGSYLLAWYNRTSGLAGIDVAAGGVVQTLGTVAADLATPVRFAFSLTATTAVALVDEGDGFRPLLRRNVAGQVDLQRPAALAEYRNGFGARTSSGTVVLGGVQAGYYGEAGVRDPHLVTRADGTPYIKNGKAYLTFTQAGLAFFETAHWGVWTVDLETYAMEQVANLFFRREGKDAILGDHAGHLVLDEDNDRWILTMSTWGDFTFDGVEVNYAMVPVTTDLLRGVHIIETTRLPLPVDDLPTTAVGQWDPHVVRIRGRWYVAFVNARRFFDFFPVLARSRSGGDFTDLALVGADTGKNETEGTVMQKVGLEWYLFASNGNASPPEIRGQYPVYDLTMQQVDTLHAPHPTNIPWPMVFPVPVSQGRSRYVMVTFNGTQFHEPVLGYGTHGDVVVMEAEPVVRGRVF